MPSALFSTNARLHAFCVLKNDGIETETFLLFFGFVSFPRKWCSNSHTHAAHAVRFIRNAFKSACAQHTAYAPSAPSTGRDEKKKENSPQFAYKYSIFLASRSIVSSVLVHEKSTAVVVVVVVVAVVLRFSRFTFQNKNWVHRAPGFDSFRFFEIIFRLFFYLVSFILFCTWRENGRRNSFSVELWIKVWCGGRPAASQ